MAALIVFYLLGLVAIGVVAFLCAKACPEKMMAANIAGWGMAIAVIWIVFGGLVVSEYIMKN